MTIDVNNESGSQVDEAALAQLARFVLDRMGIDPLAELSIVLLDSESMEALHKQWMDLPGPTDVMAFPMDAADLPREDHDLSGPRMSKPPSYETLLGDVVLCPEVAAQQAKVAGHSTESELHLLCTHGVLHLLGYDHGEPDEEREMFAKQADIVGAWAESTGREPVNAPLPGTGGEGRASTSHGPK